MIKTDLSGPRSLIRTIKRQRGWHIQMKTRSTEERTAKSNADILTRQADEGRDAITLTREEVAKGMAVWLRAVKRITRGGRPIMEAADIVARMMESSIKRHISRSRGAEGPFNDVLPRTKKRKRPGQGPLNNSGQLLRSVYFELKPR